MQTFSLSTLPEGRTIALCCYCGQARVCSSRFRRSRRFNDCEGMNGSGLARRRASGECLDAGPFWRLMNELKCDNCREVTPHAVIRQSEHRNFAEETDRKRPIPQAQEAQVREKFAMLESIGLCDVVFGTLALLSDEDNNWSTFVTALLVKEHGGGWVLKVQQSLPAVVMEGVYEAAVRIMADPEAEAGCQTDDDGRLYVAWGGGDGWAAEAVDRFLMAMEELPRL